MAVDIVDNLTSSNIKDAFLDFFSRKIPTFTVNETLSDYLLLDMDFDRYDIEEAYRLGEANFPEENKHVAIFLVHVNKQLTEKSGKKKQFDLARYILKNTVYNAGIFIFYSVNDDGKINYRFSLVDSIPIGRKVEFKRYTFFVSPDLTNKTFRYQVVYKELFSTFKDILEAFSIEPLTKEFYKEIANWYFWALKHVKFPEGADQQPGGQNTALIRFLARIIFIWFMKRRGLIPDILFDKESLKKIVKDIDKDEESTYYKAILQNLFFATLSCEPEKRRFAEDAKWFGKGRGGSKDFGNQYAYRYKELFLVSEDEVLSLFKDIPFLNGGLFEMLDDKEKKLYIDGFTRIKKYQPVFPNFLFFADKMRVDLSEYYDSETGEQHKGDTVRGLIHILNSYNFTIDENSPVDEEIALDPELLGKVFENLLASYDDETGSTARKASGSYYTPRNIVDYMVERSLKEYFKTAVPSIDEEKLDILFSYSEEQNPFDDETTSKLIEAIYNLKVIDPAVGSGAFPMGILHRLVFLLRKLDPEGTRWKDMQLSAIEMVKDPILQKKLKKDIEDSFAKGDLDYGRKLYLIQKVIYGVDIQPIAIQIAKLRFFISLLVDENIDENAPNKGIKPLPNLETKFVAANTLYKLDFQEENSQGTMIYAIVSDLLQQLFEIRRNIFSESDHGKKKALIEEDKKIREQIVERLKEERGRWGEGHIEALEKLATWDPYDIRQAADWFDPLWMFGVADGFDIVIGNPPYVRQERIKEMKPMLKKHYEEIFDGKADLYVYFYARGNEILKNKGVLSYITSNKWMRVAYGTKLRKFVKDNVSILEVIDFTGYNVFAQTVDTCIVIWRNEKPLREHRFSFVVVKNRDIVDVVSYISDDENRHSMSQRYLTDDVFLLITDRVWRIKDKLEKVGEPLKEWNIDVYRGITTGFNRAFIIDSKVRDNILNNCKTDDERRRTEEIIKPVLRGRDVYRWGYKWGGKWIILVKYGFHEEILNKYPTLLAYLLQYEEPLKGRGQCRYSRSGQKKPQHHWLELDNNPKDVYLNQFEKRKIVWQRVTQNISFSLVGEGIYLLDSTAFIPSDNLSLLLYLLAILNSHIVEFYLQLFIHRYGNTGYLLSNQYVERIPVVPFDENIPLHKRIVELSEKIVKCVRDMNGCVKGVSGMEEQINEMVYELYGLTEEEITLIKGSLKGGNKNG